MFNKFRKFASDTSGAVAVDYIALTAVIIATGLALTTTVGEGIIGSSTTLVEELHKQTSCAGGSDETSGGSSSSTFGNNC